MASTTEVLKIGLLKKLLREDIGLLYTAIGGFGSSILGATFWLVIASLLSVGEYGLLNYYIALASTFATLGTLGLNTTVTTYLAKGRYYIERGY